MEIATYIASIFIGLTLGLIGGGGSILTVPVLVYLGGVDPVLATAYSLFVVGISSLIGSSAKFLKDQVDLKIAMLFAIPSFISVYLTRLFIMPAIPEQINFLNFVSTDKNTFIMVFFSAIMILAAFSMLKKKKESKKVKSFTKFQTSLLIGLEGIVVGVLTGIVGAGGGFLIIPALVLLAKLPMKTAIGTSLVIIGVKSLIGFLGDIQTGQLIDWSFLGMFTSFAVAGIFIGNKLSNKISGKTLKTGFGYFILIMAAFIIIKETTTL